MFDRTRMFNRLIVCTGVVFMGFGMLAPMSFGDDSHQQNMKEFSKETTDANLPPNHRIIYGTVEGVNEATLKVNAGEVGQMTPRYLELEKLEGKADLVKEGDRIEITVNNKNAVVDYHIANENH